MAESPLIDIFDLCVERLAAGETVEDCLRDYPEHAEELRSLLETGFLVFQAQADPVEEKHAQTQARARIEQALQTDFAPHTHRGRPKMPTETESPKKKNTPMTVRRSVIWIGSAAAAVFTFTLGFAFATATSPQLTQVADAGMYMTNIYLRDEVATQAARPVQMDPNADPFIYTATAYVRQATQTAIANVLSMPVAHLDAVKMTDTAIIAQATAVADGDSDGDGLSNTREQELGTDPKNADSDSDGVKDGDEVLVWDTFPYKKDSDVDGLVDGEEINTYGTNPLNSDTDGDGSNDGDEINFGTNALSNNDEFALTATQFVAEITQTAVFANLGPGTEVAMINPSATTTATPSPTPLPTMTAVMMITGTANSVAQAALPTLAPVGTIVPDMGRPSTTGSDTAIMGEVASTSVALYLPMTATSFPASASSGFTDPAAPPEPVVVGGEFARDSDDFKAGDGIDIIVPYSSSAIPLSTPFVPDTTSSDVLGGAGMLPPVNMQQPLDPMNAGEIDDNAEWDTYTEFRRNYITSFGAWTVSDFDVSGRRIIKVVDALGKPILGAHVVVYMDQLKVSNTYTYATGMTLFFPNAMEETKRRDEFQISVIYDQYEVTYKLDLRDVGDIVEIKMPIVIVREPIGPYTPDFSTMPTVPPISEDALNAAGNATFAAEQATMAAENAHAAATAAEAASYNGTLAADAAATANYLAGTALPPTPAPTTIR